MHHKFKTHQLEKIKKQAIIYQCACPASVVDALISIRSLYNYQEHCEDASETDKRVHQRIKLSVEKIHLELEECLEDVLSLEGWDKNTLTMPDDLKKRMIESSK